MTALLILVFGSVFLIWFSWYLKEMHLDYVAEKRKEKQFLKLHDDFYKSIKLKVPGLTLISFGVGNESEESHVCTTMHDVSEVIAWCIENDIKYKTNEYDYKEYIIDHVMIEDRDEYNFSLLKWG